MHVILSSFIFMHHNMSLLSLMNFHTEAAGTTKSTRQIRSEKRVLIKINKRPVLDPT